MKIFKKPLDKPHKAWYNSSVLRERETTKYQVSAKKKFLEKPKKVLDKLPNLWYNKTTIRVATYRKKGIDTMATNKNTKRDNFKALLALSEVQADPNLTAFVEHELELLDRKNTKNGEKKVNEKMEAAKAKVLDFLSTVQAATVREVMAVLETDSSQYATSVLTHLVDKGNGPVKREMVKGKSHYSLA